VKLVRIWPVVALVACAHGPATTHSSVTLVMLQTESDNHPRLATATTDALARAKISGVDHVVPSKVSIEVVQLSIECVDATPACYEAAARSLSAGKLLFAQVDDDGDHPRVTITLFDAATDVPHESKRTFDSEAAALAGVDNLVAEVLR
jgi:hypothetical protein